MKDSQRILPSSVLLSTTSNPPVPLYRLLPSVSCLLSPASCLPPLTNKTPVVFPASQKAGFFDSTSRGPKDLPSAPPSKN